MKNRIVGIIGCGLIADTHVEAIKAALPDVEISVCDAMPGKAELLRKKYNLKSSYITIDDMLAKEAPFSVHILTPPQFHVVHAIQCMEAGCHVLVEKPLAFNLDDVNTLYNIARKFNKVLCVDHSLLYQPSTLEMLRKMKLEPAGKILYINCFYGLDLAGNVSSLAPEGHWKRGLPGGAIIDSIIHPVTLAVEMTGRPVDIKVNFIGSRENPEEVLISWLGERAIASITVSTQAQPFRRVTEVTTNKQTFIIDHGTETLVSLDAGFGPKALKKLLKNMGYGYQLILGTIKTVLKVVRGKLKENPGARGLIGAFYQHLDGNNELPVTEENVSNSAYALEKIINYIGHSDSISGVLMNKVEIEKTHERVYANHQEKYVKTLVTGASGFLGSNVCKILSQTGRKIVAQVRRGQNSDKLNFPNTLKIFEDFAIGSVDYNRLVEGVQEVIHCTHAAGAKTWEEFKKVNVDASLALYDAAEKVGCEKFIFISSVAVYGVHQKGHISVNERSPAILGRSKWDFYIRSKTMAEKMLLERAEKGGPSLLIIRPGVLYAADGTRLARKSIPLKNNKRLLISFGRGKNHSPFTRVDILAEAICKTLNLESFPQGIYNMTGNPKLSAREFTHDRMKRLGVECKFFSMPVLPWRLLALTMEYIYFFMFRKTPPKLTRYILDSGTRDIYYDCSKAEKDLGWNQDAAIEP